MDIEQAFVSAETKHRKELEHFLEKVFRNVFLPSHGPDHHIRVWKYAVELSAAGIITGTGEKFAEKLIIACFLHDAGMATERSERHGVVSGELCRQYLKENDLQEDEFSDVIEAVIKHDDKKYTADSRVPPLNIILNIADDLDAFGFTGIYRYIEILSERNISSGRLGEKILENASARFRNFAGYFGGCSDLFEKHRDRFGFLENFCMNYISQARTYRFGSGLPSGYCGVAEIIKLSLKQRMNITDFRPSPVSTELSNDVVISEFFSELEKELNSLS